ncbi:MAG: EAL domain-containing protein [Halofilum sp. (in: g-proteobacteria)]|nr:EAL domain-containing protein [Halofilum sp. (in: g-proteobacteria)]
MPNVVIVDDQATDRQILDRLTRNLAADIEAYAFARPSEALQWLRSRQPDLILVDYRMPEMDGVAFVEALTELPSCRGIPVVVITVVDDSDLRYRALEAGATDFLTKPLDLQECEARCRNLLTLRRQQLTIARHAEHLADARRRTGRALRTLSLCNELLIASHTEPDLLHGMCRIIAEQAGYPLVRVGLWDDYEKLNDVVCVPSAARRDVTALAGRDAGAVAIDVRHSAEVRIFNDLSTSAADNPWIHHVRGAGFVAMALLPVRIENLVEGVLAVFSHQTDAFDQDEVELLLRTANTLGYGLAGGRARRARDRAERDCRYLTHFDRLTGLPNRNRLLERLREVAESDDAAHEAAVLVLNLDRFKLVNDTTGHQAGDQLLLQVVRRLQAVVRENELLARQSGDEFVILIHPEPGHAPETDVDALDDHATRTAHRVIEAMRRPFEVAGFEYYIGVSIGVSRIGAAEPDVQSVLRQADTAMRQAKEAGGNTYVFYSGELTERHTRRLSLEGQLRRAIEEDAFVLHFQPIVALANGHTVGVEALVRWPQEDGSLLAPDAFIPLAEETGLMERLGHVVFRMACEQVRDWEQEGITTNMSVNLSVHQLLRPRLAEDLGAVMDACGTSPARLELEVTESAMMTDPMRTERIVHALHERGIGIALDDFGMGYSSLSRLKHLPITTLKIDRTFVLGLPSDPAERTIVRSIVQLAENLGVRGVAEGIESSEHQRVLQSMGCLFGQGYHFGMPRAADEVRGLLEIRASGREADDGPAPRRQSS